MRTGGEAGFTLPEVMLAIALGTSLTAAALMLVPDTLRSSVRLGTLTQLQLNLQTVSQLLRSELMRAGHAGCLGRLPAGEQPLEIVAAGTKKLAKGHILNRSSRSSSETAFAVSYAVPPAVAINRQVNGSNQISFSVAATDIAKESDFARVLITDCSTGAIRTNMTLDKSGAIYNLTNLTAAELSSMTGDLFLYRYVQKGYYIRPISQKKGADGNKIYSLYEAPAGGSSSELIQGIARMRTVSSGGQIRLGLLLEDFDGGLNGPGGAQTYGLAGIDVPHDGGRAAKTLNIVVEAAP
ncbi:MAG: prepilin-type N-terminal cleavage/methylation domain-containing protein [Gammaproteobacteria bacterium AqS3]|nr:prepilin-type N-terminal cleavage/methylation domain-containing protein [Gammaproteobacteria bacterium AqS3]